MSLKGVTIFITLCFVLGYSCPASRAEQPQGAAAKRILVLCSYHPNYAWAQSVMEGIHSVFDTEEHDVILHFEYMDTKLHQPAVVFDLLRTLYGVKYADIAFDVIIASDNNALDFLMAYRDNLFPGTPVVFCGIVGFRDSMIRGRRDFTGILETYDIAGTIEVALKIHPDTRYIAVVSGVSTSSLIHQSLFYRQQATFAGRVTFIDLCRLNPSHLKRRLETLPDHTVILYLAYYKAPDGTFFSVPESTTLVFEHSKRPIYSLWRHTIGHGVVGGMMIDGVRQGQKAAEYALRIIIGAKAASLPVIRSGQAEPVFDYNMLKHNNIPKSRLPANAVILNEPRTPYYRYKYRIWAIIAFCLLQSATIVMLRQNLRRRRNAETALKASEELHRVTMENILDPVFITDDDGRFTFVWPNVMQVLGYTVDEVRAMGNIALLAGDRLVRLEALETQDTIRNIESTVIDKGGARHFYLVSVKRVAIKDGTRLYTFHDITNRKHAQKKQAQLESQLLHARKMEAIGTFAGGISHDLNNILGAIITCSEIALQDIPRSNPVHEDIRHILNAANRGRNLIRRILAFSRRQDPEREAVDVGTVVQECLALLEYVIPTAIDIQIHLPEEPAPVWADPTKLHQVIMNLCLNAVQAMQGRPGKLTIAVDPFTLPSASSSPVPELKPGPYIRISVSDTGLGMEESVMDRIFDPFFTTRGHAGGTGLGLSVAHGIVTQDGGAIKVDSIPGQGSTFYIYLPMNARESASRAPVRASSPLPGNERILLVDDDADMLYSVGKLLERLGYRVAAHEKSVEALEVFQKDPDGFDLVITDQVMPSMTGLELAQRISGRRPDLPVILCSGFLDEHSLETSEASLRDHGVNAFIHKPFSSVEFTQVIRRVLHHRGQRRHEGAKSWPAF